MNEEKLVSSYGIPTLASLFYLSVRKFEGIAVTRPQEMNMLVYSPYDAIIYKALDVLLDNAIEYDANTFHVWYWVQEDGRYLFLFRHNGSGFEPGLLNVPSTSLYELRNEVLANRGELIAEQVPEGMRIYFTIPLQ